LTGVKKEPVCWRSEKPQGRNGGHDAKDILGANGVLGDFDDRDGLNRPSGSPDLRSGLSGLHEHNALGGRLLRMPLHVARSVQRVGIGPRRSMRRQSIFCERAAARGPTLSPRLLNTAASTNILKSTTCSGLPECGASLRASICGSRRPPHQEIRTGCDELMF
jgi:hypothetical protein